MFTVARPLSEAMAHGSPSEKSRMNWHRRSCIPDLRDTGKRRRLGYRPWRAELLCTQKGGTLGAGRQGIKLKGDWTLPSPGEGLSECPGVGLTSQGPVAKATGPGAQAERQY